MFNTHLAIYIFFQLLTPNAEILILIHDKNLTEFASINIFNFSMAQKPTCERGMMRFETNVGVYRYIYVGWLLTEYVDDKFDTNCNEKPMSLETSPTKTSTTLHIAAHTEQMVHIAVAKSLIFKHAYQESFGWKKTETIAKKVLQEVSDVFCKSRKTAEDVQNMVDSLGHYDTGVMDGEVSVTYGVSKVPCFVCFIYFCLILARIWIREWSLILLVLFVYTGNIIC